MQQAKILVVDDEPDLEHLILQKFRKKISSKEYEFQFARDGAEAIDIIVNNGSINLILTDINMPEMNGLDFIANVRKMSKDVPIVVLTNLGTSDDAENAIKQGAYDFLIKAEWKLDDVISKIRKILKV